MFSVPFRSVRSLRVIARESRTPTRVLCYVFISVDKKRVTAIQSFVFWSSSNVCVVEYVISGMPTVVQVVQTTSHASVKSLLRQFGDATTTLPDLPLSRTECALCRYDGGSELETIRAEEKRGLEVSEEVCGC